MGPDSSPDFSLQPVALLTIGPKKIAQVSVTYTPADAGDDVGTLNVDSNAINSPASVVLNGTGEGVQPPMEPNIGVSPMNIDFGAVMIVNFCHGYNDDLERRQWPVDD